ncbi:MAG: tetratricopeptide repeat protein [Endomicrobia bacterium]|nr:tetratricopeptide repeat protein [Endomicrobiia bacterium]
MTIKILTLILILSINLYSSFRKDINTGNKLFNKQRYNEAIEKYNSAEIKKPNSPIVFYNRGNAFYKQQLYNEAIKEYQKSLNLTKDKNLKSKILYNLGNAFLKMGDTQKAKESYLQGLLLNPKDEDIKYNLQYALLNINQPQTNQTQTNQNQKNQQSDNKNQQQKNQTQQQKYMSNQDIERLIESVNQQQKERLKELLKPQKPKLPEVDKDW